MQQKKTESPAAFALAISLKLGHKNQILMTYTNNSRSINAEHYLAITQPLLLLLMGYHLSSLGESIGPLSTQTLKTLV